jgi:MFS family permease
MDVQRSSLRVPFRHREYRLLFAAQATSEIGDWGARLALGLLLWERTGSTAHVALVTVAAVVPWVVAGPFLASLGDRFPRRRVLVSCDLLRAVAFTAMLTPGAPTWFVLALVVLAELATPPFQAARSASVVAAVPTDVYGAASAVGNIVAQGGTALGYACGGLLIAAAGPSVALAINAATFVVSAALASQLRLQSDTTDPDRARPRLAEAVGVLRGDPLLGRAAWVAAMGAGAAMAAETMLPVLAVTVSGAGLAGALTAVAAVACALCSFTLPHAGDSTTLIRLQSVCVAAGAATAALALIAGQHWLLLFVPAIAVGVMYGSFVPAQPVVGLRIPAEVRSSVFGLLQATLFAAQAAASVLAGVLAHHWGIGPAVAALLAPTALAATAAAFVAPRERLGARVAGDRRLVAWPSGST